MACPLTHPRQGALETCAATLNEHFRPGDFVLGNSKVFLKDYVPERLRLVCHTEAATRIQSHVRCVLARTKMEELRRDEEARKAKEEASRVRIMFSLSFILGGQDCFFHFGISYEKAFMNNSFDSIHFSYIMVLTYIYIYI